MCLFRLLGSVNVGKAKKKLTSHVLTILFKVITGLHGFNCHYSYSFLLLSVRIQLQEIVPLRQEFGWSTVTGIKCFRIYSTVRTQDKWIYKGCSLKSVILLNLKGFLVEFLESRPSWENQRPPENRQKSGLLWASPFTMRLVCTLLICSAKISKRMVAKSDLRPKRSLTRVFRPQNLQSVSN